MKSSINFLPAEKRRDLHQLVEIIRNEIKDCVMIILYGSYARDMYVDCDRRRDYGVTTFFMSDYDILIVTRRRLGLKEYDVYARITERFFENKQSEFYTRPQFINESISRLNKNLELGQYFYHEIKKQGIMLYSSQEFKLARCRKLNYAEIAKIARDYFNEKFQFASDFLLGARYYAGLQKYKMASFHLHQAAENYLRTIPLVYILYGYKDHALEILMDRCKTHTLQLVSVFPRNTEEERRLFYVALTRAKCSAVLSYAEMRFKWGNMEFSRASCFLREIDSRYLETDAMQEEREPVRRSAGRGEGSSALDELRRRFDYRYQQKPAAGGSQAGARFGGGSSAGVKSEAQRPVVVQPTRSTAGMRSVGIRQGESSLVEGAAPASCGDYSVGDRVSHLKFGAGVIRRIETLASDHKLVVEFSGYGEKTLLAKFAKLTKL